MNHFKSTLIAMLACVVAVFVIGCGGGGGGGGGGTNGGGGGGVLTPVSGFYLEFVSNGQIIDPLNMTVGQTAQVVFSTYDIVGVRTVLPASNFRMTGATGSATLTSAGLLTMTASMNGTVNVSADATVGSTVRTASQEASTIQGNAAISGRFLSTDGTTGVVYVTLEFFDTNGVRVGGARTMAGGNFTAAVPTSARFLSARPLTIPNGFLRSLKYQSRNYAVSGLTCPIRMPNLIPGQNLRLPASIFVPRESDGPPPPPDGCGS